ncbi:hypothetical protein FRC08_009428 [Ceratobasidium sp. 394]|nr:hypothetical protein FRC08_009428 [Ceratobasidium sp. 394]
MPDLLYPGCTVSATRLRGVLRSFNRPSHQSFLAYYEQLEQEQRVGARAEIAQESGLNGRPLFARLPSIDLSSCAPYEMMHLIFENLIPNMIHLWKGTFKWIDEDDEDYHLGRDTWKLIGNLTAQATRTIPSQFVGTLPNIDTDMGLYKAEAFSFWFTYLAPILQCPPPGHRLPDGPSEAKSSKCFTPRWRANQA